MDDKTCVSLTGPRLTEVAVALRDTTEVLAREVAVPTSDSPPWSDFEWRIARAVAVMQGISAVLLASTRWSGPPDWKQFLQRQQHHIAARHHRVSTMLERIDLQARREGITLVALKGVALHAIGLYLPGDRPMADIDLLASVGDLPATTRLLTQCGLSLTFASWRHQVFEPQPAASSCEEFGEHADRPIKIELHTNIRERLPVNEIDITEFLVPVAPHPGITHYRSIAALMMHLLLHAAGNMRAHALRQIQLHDIACLSERLAPKDWEELLNFRPNRQTLWWAEAPLVLTARYYPDAIPPNVIECLDAEWSWWLARVVRRQYVSDVSWSNIKVYALPGIEWSRNPREALEFISTRIWPSAATRAELRHFAASEPNDARIPWYGISQGARILRWVFSRPPRVQTMVAVRAALAASE